MSKTQKILVVIDPTADTQPALDRAAWLASKTNASLELFICEYDRFAAKDEHAKGSLIANHRLRLQEMADALPESGLSVSVDARWDKPRYKGITRKVIDSQPLLVVKDTHYHSALKRTLFSNTDWELIEHCPAPLLLVKDKPLNVAPRLLAAVDPLHEHAKSAQLEERILSFAGWLGAATNGEVHAVHVFDAAPVMAAAAIPAPQTASVAMSPEVVEAIRRNHQRGFQKLLETESIDESRAHLLSGDPVPTLVSCAQELDADFVIMGAVARSGLRRFVIGHTAERVLDRLPCDLIVVKPDGFECSIDAD